MDKILTVIVPTYNMEELLPRCLDSFLIKDKELMQQVEVLVVNDGSKDSSSSIAHGYEKQYPHTFIVIDKENGNYGSCVNRGLQEATGKYVKVLDADDAFNSEALQEYLRLLQNTDVDMVITSGVNVTPSDEVTFLWKFNYVSGKSYPIEELHHIWIHDVTHKTSILKQMRYHQTEGISYTDEEWVFYPMFHVMDFLASDLRLYKYTVGREGQTMNPKNWAKSMKNEILVSKGMYDYLNSVKWHCGRAQNYIEEKMSGRIAGFFQRALLNCELYDNKELIEFDKYLESNCLKVYESLNEQTAPNDRFAFYYVRYWRRCNYVLPSFINKFKLYQLWQKLRRIR